MAVYGSGTYLNFTDGETSDVAFMGATGNPTFRVQNTYNIAAGTKNTSSTVGIRNSYMLGIKTVAGQSGLTGYYSGASIPSKKLGDFYIKF